MSNPRGTQVSEAVIDSATAAHLRTAGDANIAKKGLSIGNGQHGTPVGRQDAQYVTYVVKPSEIALTIPHSLGRIPMVVNYVSQEIPATSAANSYVAITITNRNQWTASSFRANIATSGGVQDGITLTFVVA